MLKWFYAKMNKMFSSDRDFRFDFIIKNINSLTPEQLIQIKINTIYNRNRSPLSFYILKDTFKEFKTIIDEESTKSIDINYSCTVDKVDTNALISMLYVDGFLSSNYTKVIKDTLELYNTTLKYVDEIKDDKDISLHTQYNCNLFRLYIITMEDIIEKLYISLSSNNI